MTSTSTITVDPTAATITTPCCSKVTPKWQRHCVAPEKKDTWVFHCPHCKAALPMAKKVTYVITNARTAPLVSDKPTASTAQASAPAKDEAIIDPFDSINDDGDGFQFDDEA